MKDYAIKKAIGGGKQATVAQLRAEVEKITRLPTDKEVSEKTHKIKKSPKKLPLPPKKKKSPVKPKETKRKPKRIELFHLLDMDTGKLWRRSWSFNFIGNI